MLITVGSHTKLIPKANGAIFNTMKSKADRVAFYGLLMPEVTGSLLTPHSNLKPTLHWL